MKKLILSVVAIAIAAAPDAPSFAQSLPPVRQLGPVTAVAKEPLGAVSSVRQLPNGRGLVNDIIGRRVLMFDSSLSNVMVVGDTTSATATTHGPRPGGLLPLRGAPTRGRAQASLSSPVTAPHAT